MFDRPKPTVGCSVNGRIIIIIRRRKSRRSRRGPFFMMVPTNRKKGSAFFWEVTKRLLALEDGTERLSATSATTYVNTPQPRSYHTAVPPEITQRSGRNCSLRPQGGKYCERLQVVPNFGRTWCLRLCDKNHCHLIEGNRFLRNFCSHCETTRLRALECHTLPKHQIDSFEFHQSTTSDLFFCGSYLLFLSFPFFIFCP